MEDHRGFIQNLPIDMLEEIMTRVASISVADLLNARATCKALKEASEMDKIYRHVNIQTIYLWSLKQSVPQSEQHFRQRASNCGNVHIVFYKGLLELYSGEEEGNQKALQLLAPAAAEDYKPAAYAMALILVTCEDEGEGDIEKGVAIFHELWKKHCLNYCRETFIDVSILAEFQKENRLCGLKKKRICDKEGCGKHISTTSHHEFLSSDDKDDYSVNACVACMVDAEVQECSLRVGIP